MLQTADQALHAQQEVKAYGARASEMARYGLQTAHNVRLALKVEVTRGSLSMFVQTLGAIGLAGMLVVSGYEASAGRLSAGDFTVLLTSMVALVPTTQICPRFIPRCSLTRRTKQATSAPCAPS